MLCNCFLLTRKRTAGVFKFLRFEERFQKAPLSWRISVDDKTNCRNKAEYLYFSGAVWVGFNLSLIYQTMCQAVQSGIYEKTIIFLNQTTHKTHSYL